MISQLDLEFSTNPATSAEAIGYLAEVLQILNRHTGWLTAEQLLDKLALEPREWRKRWLRGLVENSDGQIISGQAGYRATRHATPEEIHHAAAWLRSQAQRMDAKAGAILRAGHQLLNHGTPTT